MNLGKFKDLAQKVNILKNYSSLLVPIVIALVGIFLLVPSQLMSRGLKKQIENESLTVGKKIQSLSGDVVVSDQWKVEQEYQKAFTEDANQIASLVKHSSERTLLSYKIFPEPKDTSTLVFKEFGQRYREVIETRLAKLNAHDCPTQVEIANSLQKGALATGAEGTRQLSSGSSEIDATIVDALCRSKSRSSIVYANAADLAGYLLWENYEYVGMEQAVQDCWFWQLSSWVIQDVLDTIEACDSGSASVFESPVKRLLYVDFASQSMLGMSNDKRADVRPVYVTSVQHALVVPCTARLCNSDIDVVHFELAVIVRAKEIIPFMKELCSGKEHKFHGFSNELAEQVYKHNQITILGVDIESVDLASQAHRLYRYGDDAVMKLSLSCEYIFDKSGYDAIKPALIKQAEFGTSGQSK